MHEGNVAVAEWGDLYNSYIWADVEEDSGWNSIVACDTIMSAYVPPPLDAATLNGFFYAVETDDSGDLTAGVYSSPDYWDETFGCINCPSGSSGHISSKVVEWTHQQQTRNAPGTHNEPSGWCMSDACAEWFGGVTSSSSNSMVWQWAANHLPGNYGDFDQIDDAAFAT